MSSSVILNIDLFAFLAHQGSQRPEGVRAPGGKLTAATGAHCGSRASPLSPARLPPGSSASGRPDLTPGLRPIVHRLLTALGLEGHYSLTGRAYHKIVVHDITISLPGDHKELYERHELLTCGATNEAGGHRPQAGGPACEWKSPDGTFVLKSISRLIQSRRCKGTNGSLRLSRNSARDSAFFSDGCSPGKELTSSSPPKEFRRAASEASFRARRSSSSRL